MKKKLIILSFVILFSNFSYSNSLFDSNYYEITFSSTNINEDKQTKINELKIHNLKTILKDILNNSNYNKIKRKIDYDMSNYFIKNIVLKDEKIVNNNYYSKILINFDKDKIIKFLRNENLSYVEYIPEDFLTIIYENKNISKNLFSRKYNSHYKFLTLNKNLLNFYGLPNFDINDRFLINISDIENQNLEKINNFQNKYLYKNSLIIIVNENQNNIVYNIYLNTNNNMYLIKNFETIDYDYESFFTNLIPEVIDVWKTNNSIQNKNIFDIVCVITYFNLMELKEIKNNIKKISIIDEIKLKKISFKKNKYVIKHYGDQNILYELFKINNLKIDINNEECLIKLK